MFRSVTESKRASKPKRVLHWAEGVLLGALICLLLLLGLGWLAIGN